MQRLKVILQASPSQGFLKVVPMSQVKKHMSCRKKSALASPKPAAAILELLMAVSDADANATAFVHAGSLGAGGLLMEFANLAAFFGDRIA